MHTSNRAELRNSATPSSRSNIHDTRTYRVLHIFSFVFLIQSGMQMAIYPLALAGWVLRAQYRGGPAYCSRIFIYSASRLALWLSGFLSGCLAFCLAVWLACWLACWFAGWPAGR